MNARALISALQAPPPNLHALARILVLRREDTEVGDMSAAGRAAVGAVGAAAAVVMDITSSTCRAGFAGGGGPETTFPCVVGRRRGDPDTVFIGEEALKRRTGIEL